MQTQPLARLLRPRTLQQVFGHSTTIEILKQALIQQKIHSAYLFSGTRGVGKTTLARIIAKSLNCKQGITTEPCLTCSACVAIEKNNFIDVIEIDGAAKTKVEDTRALLENVQYATAEGRFKVYIIDEVHMLSTHSFNALLKTLEEPPEHVKFILATTESKKIPTTIVSRCQHFHLRNFTNNQIVEYLCSWLKTQTIPYVEPAVNLISKIAAGSIRDALTILEQCLILGDNQLALEPTLQVLSLPDPDFLPNLLQHILSHNVKEVFILIDNIANFGQDFYVLLQELSALLHDIALEHAFPASSNNPYAKQFTQVLSPRIHMMYDIVNLGLRDFSYLPQARHAFDMVILRLLDFQPAIIHTPVLTNVSAKEPYLPPILKTDTIAPAMQPNKHNIPQQSTSQRFDWSNILLKLNLSGLLKIVMDNAKFISYDNHILTLSMTHSYKIMLQKQHLDTLNHLLTNMLHEKLKLVITSESIKHIPNVSAPKTIAAPKIQQQERNAVLQDPLITEVINTFDAQITTMERLE